METAPPLRRERARKAVVPTEAPSGTRSLSGQLHGGGLGLFLCLPPPGKSRKGHQGRARETGDIDIDVQKAPRELFGVEEISMQARTRPRPNPTPSHAASAPAFPLRGVEGVLRNFAGGCRGRPMQGKKTVYNAMLPVENGSIRICCAVGRRWFACLRRPRAQGCARKRLRSRRLPRGFVVHPEFVDHQPPPKGGSPIRKVRLGMLGPKPIRRTVPESQLSSKPDP